METFGLHELILCVSEDFYSKLLHTYNGDMGTFDLHGLMECVSEGFPSQLLCIHSVGMGTSDLALSYCL